MLPTTGYFKDIDCPYFNSSCDRPYCHFRHRKKSLDLPESTAATPKSEVPTYNPTPKSQLASNKSHIPISYVPDLKRTEHSSSRLNLYSYNNSQPTYNPTPLSILSIKNKSDKPDSGATNGSSKHEPYNPECAANINVEINFEDLDNEFDMIDEIILDSDDTAPQKKDKKVEHIDKKKPTEQPKKEHKKHEEKRSSKESKKKESSQKSKKSTRHKSSSRKESSKKTEKCSSKESKSSKHKRSESKSKHKSDLLKSKHKSDVSKSKRKPDKKPIVSKEKTKVVSSDGSNCGEDVDDYDFDDEEDTLSECYKIFNEYQPPKVEVKIEAVVKEAVVEVASKKRVAYDNAVKTSSLGKPQKALARPAQIMTNRYKLAARAAHSGDEMRNLKAEMVKEGVKRVAAAVAPTFPAKVIKIAPKEKPPQPNKLSAPLGRSCLVDDILNGRTSSSSGIVVKPKRIAPVANVGMIQQAKARIQEIARLRAASMKTPSQTASKGTGRVAHVPDVSLSELPDVLHGEKSKLPVNVRTRYLTMVADECVKLYIAKEDAYNRALSEEYKCYERCSALTTYRNSAMLAVNRLRKEIQEREKSGQGPFAPGETAAKTTAVNHFSGNLFYENVKPYLMTEDELDLHGYPREGATYGRAVFKTQKHTPASNLEENERRCCRCSKIYRIDDEGFPLAEEDCLYHPLKKRTFRGESRYLCCKSGDDTGCVISNTHVSDAPDFEERQLEGYQTTFPPDGDSDPRSRDVYALDCEMCYTTKGLELTRVTIVNSELKTVYESLVKPLNPIIDYNTRFSGITPEQMERTATNILQVQANILHLCNAKTVLIGHSLESDMKALKIIHGSVIDTSVMFPHKFGLPHKRALRALASEYLKKIIQNDVSGHDSAEDALACMELVIWKVREDLKVRGIKV